MRGVNHECCRPPRWPWLIRKLPHTLRRVLFPWSCHPSIPFLHNLDVLSARQRRSLNNSAVVVAVGILRALRSNEPNRGGDSGKTGDAKWTLNRPREHEVEKVNYWQSAWNSTSWRPREERCREPKEFRCPRWYEVGMRQTDVVVEVKVLDKFVVKYGKSVNRCLCLHCLQASNLRRLLLLHVD